MELIKFEKLKTEYEKLEKKLSLPEIINDNNKLKEYGRRYSELQNPILKYKEYLSVQNHLLQAESLYNKEIGEMKELAFEEKERLLGKVEIIKKELDNYFKPKDTDSVKNVIMEIRAGTGGDEAALFCGNLFRMYSKFFETKKWKIDIYSVNKTGLGGLKEIIFAVEGKNVYGTLKWENGVHRVQRIPETESSGRIHTSAASVFVFSQADEKEIKIKKDDLRIDTYRSSGKGGQHVNVTDSAVRITHLPTSIVAQCQDERSQFQNRQKAMNMLLARIKDKIISDKNEKESKHRQNQIGSGDRSEKIRTYNFPQNRITDHRINMTVRNLDSIIEGNLGSFIEEVKKKIEEIGSEASKV